MVSRAASHPTLPHPTSMKLQLVDRLAELPYRVRPWASPGPQTWPVSKADLARISILWPGDYDWKGYEGIMETIKRGLTRLGALRLASTPQTFRGVVTLECRVDGVAHTVILDLADKPEFLNRDALAACSLYIKAEYGEEGYGDPKVIRGGYPVTGNDFYKYYRPYRTMGAKRRLFDVVGRFGYQFQGEIRRKGVELLSIARDINYVGAKGKVRYSRFLREVAASRLCLHLPGNGPFTHRVAEFCGLGSCMVSIRFTTELHVPLEPGVHYVQVADDLSDLVDKCRYYIAHDAEREAIAAAGREYFDRYLHCDQLACYYVRTILDRIGGGRA